MTPQHGAEPAPTDSVAREVAVIPVVPEPRPEILARVLDGLRGLPPLPAEPADVDGAPAASPAMPLPRRHC